MSKNAQKVTAEPSGLVGAFDQEALDEIQTKLQVLLNDFTDVASTDLTKMSVAEMKQMVQNLSRIITQAEAKLRQT